MSISKNKIVELRGKNTDVLSTIQNNRHAKEFAIKRKISKKILYLLLETTDVKKIIISKKIALTLPKKSLEALAKTGIDVCVVENVKKGRREKYDIKMMAKLLSRSDIALSKLAQDKKIPLRTLYYYKKKVQNAREK